MKYRWLLCISPLLLTGISPAWAVNPAPSTPTEIELVCDAEIMPDVWTYTNNGQVSKITVGPNGTAIKLVRNAATTLPWTEQTTTDGVTAHFTFATTNEIDSGLGGPNTCCKYWCDGGGSHHFSWTWGDCIYGEQGCEICTVDCQTGYVNCPVGTKKLRVIE